MCFEDYWGIPRETLWWLALALAFASGAAFAGPHDYQCITKNGFRLDENGALNPHPVGSLFIGEQFAVDRQSGRVVGGMFDNGDPFAKITVVHRGDANNAFKVFTQKSGHAQLLIIAEHRGDKLTPFVGLSLSEVLTGVCR